MSLIRWKDGDYCSDGVALNGIVTVRVSRNVALNEWQWISRSMDADHRKIATRDEAKAHAEAHLATILRSAGWIPASEATPVNAERQAVRFAAVDLPPPVPDGELEEAEHKALKRVIVGDGGAIRARPLGDTRKHFEALGRWMVGEGEHPLIKPAD